MFTKVPSEFKAVLDDVRWHDALYKFLQNIYRLYPEDRFHALIKVASKNLASDEAIYRHVQRQVRTIKPFLADLTFALPSLFKQKKEMARQTLELLGSRRKIDGYAEIGSTGRYISELRKHIAITGPITLVNDVPPSNSPADLMERGGFREIGSYIALTDYQPLALEAGCYEMVTCYIGLHHIPLNKLQAFIDSIVCCLKPGGVFILRDHDVVSAEMNTFVSLIHSVFNLGLNAPWETDHAELRFFRPVAEWEAMLSASGLIPDGRRLVQAHDPSNNILMQFTKAAA